MTPIKERIVVFACRRQMLFIFEILGLFGDRDVRINFPSIASIIVSDNGTGKTTILNALYSILSSNLSRLAKLDFREINIKFSKGELVKVRKDDVFSERLIERDDAINWRLSRNISKKTLMDLLSTVRTSDPYLVRHSPLFEEAIRQTGLPPDYLHDALMRMGERGEVNTKSVKKLKEVKEAVSANFDFSILYFTTYRRVEEDLQAFGNLKEEHIGSNLIKFGMSDVEKRFETITRTIRDTSAQSYSKISGQMLNQLVDKFEVTDEMLNLISNDEQVKIILGRTGGNLSEKNRETILSKIRDRSITDNKYLAYFLSKLMEVYNAQRDIDDEIKQFIGKVSAYLVNKEVIYDEFQPRIYIEDKASGNPINLSHLSSGEKQLISMLSRLYLERGDKKVAIIFDEPELSLSTEWQKKLLPDIIDSGRCGFLLAATHSPFIFDNGLDHYARDLEIRYMESRKNG